MRPFGSNAVVFLLVALILYPLVAAQENDPLSIPDTNEGVPGLGPLRRSDWFRGVWRGRRSSWLSKTEEYKGSIVFLGDSITQGWKDDFMGFFGDLKVVNRGISGDTSRGLLLRLPEDVIALDPKAVVIMIGANDLAEKASGETVFSNVKLMVERLKEQSETMKIIVCETFPCAPDDYRPVAEIQKINSLYAAAWRKDPRVIVLQTYRLFAGPDGASLPKLLPDRVHPNTAGYAVWFQAMNQVFRDLGLSDGTSYPHAWIHFSGKDKEVTRFHGLHVYRTKRPRPVEITIEIEPEPGHHLAFQWVIPPGPVHSISVDVNGRRVNRVHSPKATEQPTIFWDSIPVTEFGITKRERKGSYKISISGSGDAEEAAMISGVRLISHRAQLGERVLPRATHKAIFDTPGPGAAEGGGSR